MYKYAQIINIHDHIWLSPLAIPVLLFISHLYMWCYIVFTRASSIISYKFSVRAHRNVRVPHTHKQKKRGQRRRRSTSYIKASRTLPVYVCACDCGELYVILCTVCASAKRHAHVHFLRDCVNRFSPPRIWSN